MEENKDIYLKNRDDRQKCLWIATGIVAALALIHTLTIWLLPFPSWWKVWFLLLPFIWWKSHKLTQEAIYYNEGIEGIAIIVAVSCIVFTSITLCLLPLYLIVWFMSKDKTKALIKKYIGMVNE